MNQNTAINHAIADHRLNLRNAAYLLREKDYKNRE